MSAPALSIVQPAHGGGDGGGMTVFEMVRAWQQFLEVSGRASALTRSSYRYALLRFFADVLVDPREITEQMVVDHQLTLDPHGSTRNDQLRALKSFYRWASEAGIVRDDAPQDPSPQARPGPEPVRGAAHAARRCRPPAGVTPSLGDPVRLRDRGADR